MNRPRRMFAGALVAVIAFAVAGCGGSSDRTTGSDDTSIDATPMAQASTPPSDAKVIKVTLKGGSVTPSGEKVEVKNGQPVVFQIDSDVAAELHVHSSPAQGIEFPAGQSQAQVTINQPGVVEAEIEETGTLVVQLEVR
ncbi:MAG TPA: hypothetical protein VFE07_02860 [Marmoricola sp.]|nr:hypothetical protein [Marmoricola sp.]